MKAIRHRLRTGVVLVLYHVLDVPKLRWECLMDFNLPPPLPMLDQRNKGKACDAVVRQTRGGSEGGQSSVPRDGILRREIDSE